MCIYIPIVNSESGRRVRIGSLSEPQTGVCRILLPAMVTKSHTSGRHPMDESTILRYFIAPLRLRLVVE